MNSRLRPYALATVALCAAIAASPAAPSASAAGCPPGYERTGRTEPGTTDWVARLRGATDVPGIAHPCARTNHPESARELDAAAAQQSARMTAPFTTVRAGAREAAMRAKVAAAGSAVPGTTGAWDPVGTTPLIGNEPGYDSVNGEGLVELNGRIQDFVYDSAHDTVYVAVAQGGVYKSTNRGNTWVSISDTLPNLTVGSVGWSTAGGGPGTLVVITGDSNGGGNSVPGTGAYWTADGGATWHKSAGIPDGMLGFRVAADPTHPSTFYAGTGGGLYRSTDAGRTFANVNLPTGRCAGKPVTDDGCFFANQVTDVVVQAPGGSGNVTGGKVVAVVGWRAGQKLDRKNRQQAPGNGLYGSDTGAPDSFTRLDDPQDGFASQSRIGRTELGAATGPTQDHNYLYAVVEDADKFNSGVPVTDANEVPAPVLGANNVLAGIYVSADFGQTWTLMADGEAISQGAVAEGSALGGTAQAQLYSPGVQAWYNEWIKPDPTRTDTTTHAPTRLLFGLEEVWQNEDTTAPQVGPSSFKVIGRYFAGNTCFFLGVPEVPYCPPYRAEPQGGTTTHPDQHGVLFIPGPDEGGVTLLVGNDGGAYRQVVKVNEEFTNAKWGNGVNRGFHTLLPYGLAVGPDGTVWAGLQDNGHLKIPPNGRQIMTFGGDGTWALVDPTDSDVAYEATPTAAMNVTKDGGLNWTDINPSLTSAQFVAQFAMDPLDSAHLVVGGQEIKEATNAPTVTWKDVWNLGTVDNPGTPPSQTDMSEANTTSAIDVVGDATYVGWCGVCDVVTHSGAFKSGIATNVGTGAAAAAVTAKAGTWHFATAAGLPRRYVTSVHADPDDPSTVYVTLGGYGRRWVPPGANGDDAANVGTGHVFRSTDAGEHFTDITGNLPDAPANYLIVRGTQLIVGTDFGVFASTSRAGGPWGLLGAVNDLPNAPVLDLALRPGHPNELYVSTYGRGIYKYLFDATAPVVQPPVVTPPKPKPPTHLPTTGLPAAVPVVAALATGVTLAVRRRRRAGAAAVPGE